MMLLVAALAIQVGYRERGPVVMALHARQTLVLAMTERKLSFGSLGLD
jgi:hypothetical protein